MSLPGEWSANAADDGDGGDRAPCGGVQAVSGRRLLAMPTQRPLTRIQTSAGEKGRSVTVRGRKRKRTKCRARRPSRFRKRDSPHYATRTHIRCPRQLTTGVTATSRISEIYARAFAIAKLPYEGS